MNNAGVGLAKGTLASTKEDIDFTFGVNVYAPIFMVQAVIPHMPHGGRIINISSVASKVGDPFSCLYGPSKAALDSLSYTWASEVLPWNSRKLYTNAKFLLVRSQ